MSYHQFQMFEKIGTEESQIETSIELSETVNLFINQNTYFLSNSPNDLIFAVMSRDSKCKQHTFTDYRYYFNYIVNFYVNSLMLRTRTVLGAM